MKERTYYEDIDKKNELALRLRLETLPSFCKTFFIGIEPATSSRTRLAYAYDLGCFFTYISEHHFACNGMEIKDFPISILESITATDIEEYLYFLKYYIKDGVEHSNTERGIRRKVASLRTFYRYFYKKDLIRENPVIKVDTPKSREKAIVRLDTDEISKLLDEVEFGQNLTARQKKFHKKTKCRDLALMTLLLGTGIRVSECVGLDIYDVDFKNHGIKIHRKGGSEVVIYFGTEVHKALFNYLEERKKVMAEKGSQNALFLSLQNKRITVRAVENLVKKYAKLVTESKNISPHKLRSTYGTNLYRETGDIYLVADVLGHKDVNTTRKHYAALEEESRKKAADYITLRKN